MIQNILLSRSREFSRSSGFRRFLGRSPNSHQLVLSDIEDGGEQYSVLAVVHEQIATFSRSDSFAGDR